MSDDDLELKTKQQKNENTEKVEKGQIRLFIHFSLLGEELKMTVITESLLKKV